MVAFSRLPLGMPSLSFMLVLTPVYGVGIVGSCIDLDPVTVLGLTVETRLVPVVADARSEGFDFQEQCVLVAVGGDAFYDQAVAGAFALQPELLARAAVEGGEAGFNG